MSELRLIILLIGLVFLAAVYFFSRRQELAKRERERALRQTPNMEDLPEIHVDETLHAGHEQELRADAMPDDATAASPARAAARIERRKPRERTPQESDRLIVLLHVVPASDGEFPGAATQAALERAGLRFGRYKIFHHLPDSGASQPLFSAANIVEPGSFERDRLIDSTVPGLSFFMILPGPRDGLEMFTKLLGAARQVTSALSGKLEDELHGSLTPQRIQQLREQIIEFQAHERTWRSAGSSQ
jgi:cell division protein ZipA